MMNFKINIEIYREGLMKWRGKGIHIEMNCNHGGLNIQIWNYNLTTLGHHLVEI